MYNTRKIDNAIIIGYQADGRYKERAIDTENQSTEDALAEAEALISSTKTAMADEVAGRAVNNVKQHLGITTNE